MAHAALLPFKVLVLALSYSCKIQFFSCVCGREKMSARTTVLRPGGWGETAYQVFLRCEMFSGKI